MNDAVETFLARVTRFFEESFAAHGATPAGVNWSTEWSHQLRFANLAKLIDDGEGGTIADLGCGYGAFYDFLCETGVKVDRFIGYDISEAMLAEARRRIPEGEFVRAAAIDRAVDFAFSCGIFNVRLDVDEDAWLRHIDDTLDNMNACATRGFAFDMFSTYVDYRDWGNYYGDPCRFFDRCKRRYSRNVALLHDYPLYEWTILVRK